MKTSINHVVIIGAGTMGQGIAEWFLSQKISVEIVDTNEKMRTNCLQNIHLNLEKQLNKEKITKADFDFYKKNISIKTLFETNKESDLVIEAIVENLEIKRDLLKSIDEYFSKSTIIASNTSSFSITELANILSADRKPNFLGIHFFNPATHMKLVEIINGLNTNKEISNFLVSWFNERKKVACLCKDSPGFIVNRVARNFYGEALLAVENYNEEKCAEVDLVLREVGGFKMGPFELMDLIGIDINLAVTESVYQSFFNAARFRPHRLQKEMVSANRLGKKTKIGFYKYE